MEICLPQWRLFSSSDGYLRPHLKKLKFLFLILLSVFSSAVFAQQTPITGRVTVGDTAIAGATVQVKGTNTATQTDADGRFTITAPSNATLVISSIGYVAQEVKVSNRSTVNVQLQSNAQQLSDVVVVG